MTTLYDRDFYTWTQAQADALRRRSTNAVDWQHLAEEIDSLGNSKRTELVSRYATLFVHLLKWLYQPDGRSSSWSSTIRRERREIGWHLEDNPGLKSYEAEAVDKAYRRARALASDETGLPLETFPDTPPFTLAEVRDDGFWPEPDAS